MNSAPLPDPAAPSGARTTAESSERVLSNLLRWLERGGAQLSKLQVVRRENGERDVLARSDIAVGEVVLQVPRALLLTTEVARHSEIGRRIEDQLHPDNELLYLASFLLQEKHRSDSFWKPYLDSLPEAFPHLPRFFHADELALLQGSQLVGMLEFQEGVLRREYAQLCEALPDYTRFAFEEFVWARLSVNSRAFGLDGSMGGPACVPMADMLNHRNEPDVRWTNTEDGRFFLMTAQRALSAGEEVFNTYGLRSNDLSLLHCGFLNDDNSHDAVSLSVGLLPGDALADFKQQLLSLDSPTGRHTVHVSRLPGSFAEGSVFAYLRLICASLEDFQVLRRQRTPGPTTRAGEERVLRTLAALCEERLAAFPTPLEEDARLLREAPLSPNARACIRLRHDEKRMLRDYLELSRTALGVLGLSREELERLVAQSPSPWGWFDIYVRGQLLGMLRGEGTSVPGT